MNKLLAYLGVTNIELYNKIYLIKKEVLKRMPGNRCLNGKHIDEIKQAMKDGVTMPPIIVNIRTLHIVDGNHRYFAAIELWEEGFDIELRVIFEDWGEQKEELEAAMNFNSHQKPWNTSNYVETGIFLGCERYIKLYDFCEEREEFLKFGESYKYAVGVALLKQRSIDGGIKNLPEITDDDIKLGAYLYKILVKFSIELGKSLFNTNSVLGFAKFISNYHPTVKELDEFAESPCLNNRYKISSSSTRHDWTDYYSNMWENYQRSKHD